MVARPSAGEENGEGTCTKSVLFAKLVGSAKWWQRDHGSILEIFEEWKAGFKKTYIPELIGES